MAFSTSSYEDSNFRNLGWSNGGATSSSTSGKTKGQLLDLACSHAAPNEKYFKPGVREQLKKLQGQYQNPNWHQQFCGINRFNLAATIRELEA
jgi:hypothetical protein